MTYLRPLFLAALLLPSATYGRSNIIYPHSPCGEHSKWPGCAHRTFSTELQPYTQKQYKDHGLEDTMTELGRHAKGFYITAYYIFKLGPERVAHLMQRAHMNAVVLDTKDDLGRVLWPSKVALSRGLQTILLPDPKRMTEIFHKHGIYVIGRLVSFKDCRLPYLRTDLSARIGPRAERLLSAGANWLDAYSSEVQDYVIDLALELQELGFDEIQLDYIRFPKGAVSHLGTWMHKDKRDRSTLISDFLERIDRAVSIPLSVDIYGLTTLVDGDPRQLGQTIESMARYVDAISPMMYANGMDSYFKNNTVTEQVYNLIHCGLWRARNKAPKTVLRPFLQAYANNVTSFFGPEFIIRQVKAAEQAGCNGFLFWNSSMQNGPAYAGLRRLGAKYMAEYGDQAEQYKAPRNVPGSWCKRSGDVFTKTERRSQRTARQPSP